MASRELVARLRPGLAVDQPLQESVRVRLQPEHLAQARGLGNLKVQHGRVHVRTPSRCAQRVEAAAGRDPIQPGAHRGAPLEGFQPSPRRQQCFLERVLGVLH